MCKGMAFRPAVAVPGVVMCVLVVAGATGQQPHPAPAGSKKLESHVNHGLNVMRLAKQGFLPTFERNTTIEQAFQPRGVSLGQGQGRRLIVATVSVDRPED